MKKYSMSKGNIEMREIKPAPINKNFEEILPIIEQYRSTVMGWQEVIATIRNMIQGLQNTEEKRQKVVEEFKRKLNEVIAEANAINKKNLKRIQKNEEYNNKIKEQNKKNMAENKRIRQLNKESEEHNREARAINQRMGFV